MKLQRYKHENEISYALGMALTVELLLTKLEYTEKVYIHTKADENENLSRLRFLCRENKIPVEENDKAFNVLSPKGNCFVIGVFRKFGGFIENGSHIVLVNPSDAGNIGTIIRTAVGFDFTNIAVIRHAVDIFDPKAVRSSMGAIFHANIKYYDNFDGYTKEFPSQNLYIFMLNAKHTIQNITFAPPFSLVFGNESSGLPSTFEKLEKTVVIPHNDKIDSLSLPVSAGIAIFAAGSQK